MNSRLKDGERDMMCLEVVPIDINIAVEWVCRSEIQTVVYNSVD